MNIELILIENTVNDSILKQHLVLSMMFVTV